MRRSFRSMLLVALTVAGLVPATASSEPTTNWPARGSQGLVEAQPLDTQAAPPPCPSQQDAAGLPTLRWPLDGTPSDYRWFNGRWDYSPWTHGSCGGQYKRHIGLDITPLSGAITGKPVYAAYDGILKAVYDASATIDWAKGVVLEHTDSNGLKFTTTYLHINPVYTVTDSGACVKQGTVLGTVANIPSPHLHFGIRRAPYGTFAKRGALPVVNQGNCACGGDPVFPEHFIDPARASYTAGQCGNGSSEPLRVNGGPPTHPNGTLIKTRTNGTVYVLRSGQRRPIVSMAVLRQLYPNGGFDSWNVVTVADDEMTRYPLGPNVTGTLPGNGRPRPDGTLIRQRCTSEISIVTDNGMRRPFACESAFLSLGFLYCNVVEVSDYANYPRGATINVACSTSAVLLNETVEGGAPGWTASTSGGLPWVIRNSSDAHSGSRDFSTGWDASTGTYRDNTNASVVSPSFSLAGRSSATLTFYYKASIETNWDYLRVEVSQNGGANWSQVWSFSGVSPGWSGWSPQQTVSLTPYVGSSNTKIRFRFTSDGSVVWWGAVVDDIQVTAQ
jgi:murein DD-endopeptidase MepM/ murein hydrolase activator NlpD